MMPCKLTSPAFAVTAAVLGGLALAVSTCQADAAVVLHTPDVTYTAFDGIYDPSWRYQQFDENTLVLSGGYAQTAVRLNFGALPFRLEDIESVALTIDVVSPLPAATGDQLYLNLGLGELGFTEDPVRDFSLFSRRRRELSSVFDWDITGRFLDQYEADSPFTLEILAIARDGDIELASPVLRVTLIPEPTPPVLCSLALLLFAARRRRLAGKNRPIVSSLPQPRG